MYKKILLPTDGSSLSGQAAAAAVEFALAQGSEIVTISVAQPFPSMAAEAALALMESETRILLEVAQENVDQVAAMAKLAGVPCKTITTLAYAPHEEIIKAALDNQCDLIFMASHGRRGLSRLLAGSVTQAVLAYSTIPVLVLRPGLAS
jgi:nucleotide-binding universal stress UspA family protein